MKRTNIIKTTSLIFILTATLTTGLAALPQPSHEVYGTITDSDSGYTAEGINVSAKISGQVVDSMNSQYDGYYSVEVPYNYSGQDFDIFIDGTNETRYTFESGSIDNFDISANYIPEVTVSIDDQEVDEDSSIDLEPSVTNPGSNPTYTWSITGDDYGSSFTDPDTKDTTFNAPNNVSEDKDVDIELEVVRNGKITKTDAATITIKDTDTSSSDSNDGSSSGSGSGAGAAAVPTNNQDKISESISLIEQGQTRSVKFEENKSKDIEIGEIGITANKKSSNVEITVQDLGKNKPDTISSKPDGELINYQEISISGITDSDINESTITFKVRKTQVEDMEGSKEDIRLQRYNEDTWNKLDTQYKETTEDKYRYTATTPGYSTYAITLEEPNTEEDSTTDPQDNKTKVNKNQTEAPESTETGEDKNFKIPWTLIIALIVSTGLGALGVLAYIKREEIEKFMTEPQKEEEDKKYSFN